MWTPKYKYGIRVERTYSFWIGFGVNMYSEVCVVLSLGFCEISIGKVYDNSK